MAYGQSNGFVTDGVTWPWKVKVVTLIRIEPILENGWRYSLGPKGPPIGNGLRQIEWSRDRWHHVTPICLGPNITKNSWRCHLATIAITRFCCELVRSAILASSDSLASCIFLPFDAHSCHMGTAIIKHPMPDQDKRSFVIFDIRTLWRSALSIRVPGCQKLRMTA